MCYFCENDDVCPLFTGLWDRPIRELHEGALANLVSYKEQADTLIDNSKHVRWARRFLNETGLEQKYIHLIRDPRALVRRWLLYYDTEKARARIRRRMARRCWPHAWEILRCSDAEVCLWLWLYRNRLTTDFIRRHGLNARVVTYSDLACDPGAVLPGIMDWLGHEFEPGQESYWRFVHHGSFKPKYIEPPKEGARIFDQRWKDFLDEKTQDAIFTHPGVSSYLDELGVEFDEAKGLTGKRVQGRTPELPPGG